MKTKWMMVLSVVLVSLSLCGCTAYGVMKKAAEYAAASTERQEEPDGEKISEEMEEEASLDDENEIEEDVIDENEDDSESTEDQAAEEEPEYEEFERSSDTAAFDALFEEHPEDEESEEDMYDYGYDYEMPLYDDYYDEHKQECLEVLEADEGQSQEEVESDTIQWMNGTYALITESNGKSRKLVGGAERSVSEMIFYRYQLEEGWDVVDEQSAAETLVWLERDGHRVEYEDYKDFLEEYGMLDVSEKEFEKAMADSLAAGEFDDEDIQRFFAVYECSRQCPDVGILAWDLVRVNQLAGWYYVAGYLTLNESLEIQLTNSKEMQAQFDSWDDLMTSYLLGYQFWSGENADASSSELAVRRNIYESLKVLNDSPYALDFNMKLKRTWDRPENTEL